MTAKLINPEPKSILDALETKNISIEDGGFDYHELAGITPWMTATTYIAFRKDIEVNGQNTPILIYRNKIVDGRHRQRALLELGRIKIKAIILPHKTTKAEIQDLVQSMEQRRHDTKTQLAIMASRMAENGLTQKQAADSIGVGIAQVKRVSSLNKIRPDLVEALFGGQYITIGKDKDGKDIRTDALSKVLKYAISGKEQNKESNNNIPKALEDKFRAIAHDFIDIATFECDTPEQLGVMLKRQTAIMYWLGEQWTTAYNAQHNLKRKKDNNIELPKVEIDNVPKVEIETAADRWRSKINSKNAVS